MGVVKENPQHETETALNRIESVGSPQSYEKRTKMLKRLSATMIPANFIGATHPLTN